MKRRVFWMKSGYPVELTDNLAALRNLRWSSEYVLVILER